MCTYSAHPAAIRTRALNTLIAYTIKCKWRQDGIFALFLPGEGNSLLMECADVMAIASKGRLWSNLINLLFGKAFANKV